MIHSFDLRDLLSLRALAGRGISLDSQTCLTEDLHLLRRAILAHVLPEFIPETMMLDCRGGAAGFAQLGHRRGEASSRLRFLSPKELFLDDTGTELIEALLRLAGRRRAHHILADAEENTDVCNFLRRTLFSVYARQDIWMGSHPFPQSPPKPPGILRPLYPSDAAGVHALYCSIVPALVHQVEGFPRRPKGWIVLEEGELVGLFCVRTGARGLWMDPIFHPGARRASEWIAAWLGELRISTHRPVYVCVRSYQDWVGPILRDLGFSLNSRRAVLVRRVVVSTPVEEGLPIPAVEKPMPQTTTYTSTVSQNNYDSATANHR